MKHDPQDVQCTNLGQSQVLELRRWLGNVALFFAEGKAVPEGSLWWGRLPHRADGFPCQSTHQTGCLYFRIAFGPREKLRNNGWQKEQSQLRAKTPARPPVCVCVCLRVCAFVRLRVCV